MVDHVRFKLILLRGVEFALLTLDYFGLVLRRYVGSERGFCPELSFACGARVRRLTVMNDRNVHSEPAALPRGVVALLALVDLEALVFGHYVTLEPPLVAALELTMFTAVQLDLGLVDQLLVHLVPLFMLAAVIALATAEQDDLLFFAFAQRLRGLETLTTSAFPFHIPRNTE